MHDIAAHETCSRPQLVFTILVVTKQTRVRPQNRESFHVAHRFCPSWYIAISDRTKLSQLQCVQPIYGCTLSLTDRLAGRLGHNFTRERMIHCNTNESFSLLWLSTQNHTYLHGAMNTILNVKLFPFSQEVIVKFYAQLFHYRFRNDVQWRNVVVAILIALVHTSYQLASSIQRVQVYTAKNTRLEFDKERNQLEPWWVGLRRT